MGNKKSLKQYCNLYRFSIVFLVAISFSCKERENSKEESVRDSSTIGDKKLEGKRDLNDQKRKSIYEIGDSITSYDKNFENLFQNWITTNIDNANDYKLIDYSFVETISDSSTYREYRNYFTSDKFITANIRRSASSGNGKEKSTFFVSPTFPYQFLHKNIDSTNNYSKWMNGEFQKEALNLLNKNLNLDTIKLLQYQLNEDKLEYSTSTYPFLEVCFSLKVRSKETISRSINKFSIDSLTQNYIDVVLKQTKKYDELDPVERRGLALEELLINRITNQLNFTRNVAIDDKVYAIDMKYKGENYHLLVICDVVNKKVIWDPFFLAVIPEN